MALLLSAGCAAITEKSVRDHTAPAPFQAWTPGAAGRMPSIPERGKAPEVPAEYLRPGTTLSLSQLVDLALRNNPRTREAWHFARAAAAELGSKRAEFFPRLDVGGGITRQKSAAVGGLFTFLQTTYGPSAALNWLLLDFGGRAADVAEAKAALYSADWAHNAAIQDVVLAVSQAYYQYLNAKGLAVARQASLDEAQKNLNAAEERHQAGIATIADVLQAKTSVSQAQLSLLDAQGQINIIRGSLATAVGVPATIPVDVGELPQDLPLEMVRTDVDTLISQALAERPELAAKRFDALAARSHVGSVRAEGLPRLLASGTANRTYYYHPAGAPYSDNYTGSILVSIPVFTGFDVEYRTRQAQEEASAAAATAEKTEDQVSLEVWSAYYAVQTATQRVTTSRDLLASALQSAEVAEGRYREGVGSILDTLTAQAALANARAEEVQARSLWFLSIAELAHATGSLRPGAPELQGPTAAPGATPPETKGSR